jgi:membrane protease subunit HflK
MRETGSPFVTEAIHLAIRFLSLITIVMMAAYLLSGIFTIEADQIGFVTRFGRPRRTGPAINTYGPGIHFAFPQPIDQLYKISIKKIIELDIQDFWRKIPWKNQSEFCITRDQYLIRPRVTVKLKIVDPESVLFKIKSGTHEKLVTEIVSSEIIKAIATFEVDALLSISKQALTSIIRHKANRVLEKMDVGLQITSIELREIVPPRELSKSFSRVHDANIKKQTAIKKAYTRQEITLRNAHVKANAMLSQARQYEDLTRQEAESDTKTFQSILRVWKRYPAITSNQVYHDAIREILTHMKSKVFIPANNRQKVKILLNRNSKKPPSTLTIKSEK